MINFSEEEILFRSSVERFVSEKIKPLSDEIDKSDSFPREMFYELGKQGYLGLRYPEEIGESNAEFVTYLIMVEELARGSLAVAAAAAMQSLMATDFVFRYGTAEHKKRFLAPAIKGEKIGAFAMSEANAGSDLARIETTAVRGNNGWCLNGSKMWVTNGTIANFFTVAASVDKNAGLKGLRFFLVEKGAVGLVVGKKIPKLGTLGCDITELSINDCIVQDDCMLGQGGVSDLMKILDQIRVMTGALSIGLARAALDTAIVYSKQRICFGKQISGFQAIQQKIADSYTELQAATQMVYSAGRGIEKGAKCSTDAAAAKLFASEMANKVVDHTMRILAGYGYSKEFPAERYYRDARFLLIGGGTSEILRGIIAKDILA
ncbi:MAG: acyl-CoA dehydrogenase family protein [Planctomycetes bacterium]|nr:acyl-CoA dehydrogenase family protein [Planctomycetota bacterium]